MNEDPSVDPSVYQSTSSMSELIPSVNVAPSSYQLMLSSVSCMVLTRELIPFASCFPAFFQSKFLIADVISRSFAEK